MKTIVYSVEHADYDEHSIIGMFFNKTSAEAALRDIKKWCINKNRLKDFLRCMSIEEVVIYDNVQTWRDSDETGDYT